MGSTYQSMGDVCTFTAPTGGVTKDAPVLIGNCLVIPRNTVAQTLPFDGYCCGIHSGVPKATGAAWTEGANLYWDDTAKKFTTTATSNYYAGVAYAAAGSADTTGAIRLNGIGVKAVG